MVDANVFMNPDAGVIPTWSIVDRLRKAREWANLEQTELSAISGISRATISAAENGHREPSLMTVRLWALATGVSESWLVRGDTPGPDDKRPRGGALGRSLPGLDSNQEPAVYSHPWLAPITSIDDAPRFRELVAA